MLKVIDRQKVEQLVQNRPFSDVADISQFIDQVFHDLWKQQGRTTESIRSGKYHRASV